MTVTELPQIVSPVPEQSARWTPSRAGIVNVWRFYDETFIFHGGRLLLRGPNGSGKSKALELLLPFLFDANLRASRLSTFGTGERTMHWNLMGEGASGATRVGYVWMEFCFADHSPRWFSCGARLQASSNTTTVRADYFTTSLRIGMGAGVQLVNAGGQPLTRGALEEALGDHGTVHDHAGDYRSAVRSALFPGLTEQRYDALITALLQLRMPKLSQRLDPSLLSTLLSRALPPLGQQEITELAEGFERLDRQRERLSSLDEEVAATRTLANRQRLYAQRVLRANAATLISATTDLDNLTRTARHSAEESEVIASQKAGNERRAETLEREVNATRARITGVTDQDAYKQGRELDQLRRQTADAAEQATTIRRDADSKRIQADDDEAALQDAQRMAGRHARELQIRQDEAAHGALRAGLTSVHQEITACLESIPERSPALLRAAVTGRHRQLSAVRDAIDDHEQAVDRRQQAEADLDEARNQLSSAKSAHEAAIQRRDTELTQLGRELREWARACRELTFPNVDALLEDIESESALTSYINRVAAGVLEEIVREETATQARRDELSTEHSELTARLEQLAAEQDVPPAAPPVRANDRTTMSGAPFWRLVDFASHLPVREQGPIEAALQAAGLLDAWVSSSGSMPGHDTFADPRALSPVRGPSLADILVPEPGTPVPAPAIQQLLSSVSFDDHASADHVAAIGADGSWRLGNLYGAWHKDHPAHIGALARRRAREQLIGELTSRLDTCAQNRAALDGALDVLQKRRLLMASERAGRPDYRALNQADQGVLRAEAKVNATDDTVSQRISAVSAREQQVAATLRTLAALAAENGLPTERTALRKLAEAVDLFRDQADSWLEEHRQLASARRELARSARQAERAVQIAGQREGEADRADSKRQELAEQLSGAESTVGADYREILSQLENLRARETDLQAQLDEGRAELPRLAQRLGELTIKRDNDAQARDRATAARDAAAQRFRHLAAGTFPADSGLDDLSRFEATLSDRGGVRATLEGARQVAAAWPAIPFAPKNLGDALHLLSESVHASRDSLSARADLDLESDEDVQIFTAMVNGVRVGAAELLAVLRDEADRSRREITDRERELFDQTLTGDIRRHLADRIRQANELVGRMNSRLERVRTASKVSVQLVWQIAADLPPGTKAARDLLLKDPVRLTDADRESLHRFFRDRIEQAKADDTATSWEQQLAQVFDYTAWHQFVVKVDRSNGAGWQLLTRKLHGALSGGEKAIALHLPLFAAVAAHYQAVPEAPRVILLDEVFVGVDSNNRGQVFGLLAALDLDLVLTSDHEWCTYAELSGIGIHQLITGIDDDEAVTTARFTWDGYDLSAAEEDH